MAFTYSSSDGLHTFTGITTSENTTPIEFKQGGGVVASVHVIDGGGSGFNSGTLTGQFSNDGTNWIAANDMLGNAITFTAAGYFELSTAMRFFRLSADGSISDVDAFIYTKSI